MQMFESEAKDTATDLNTIIAKRTGDIPLGKLVQPEDLAENPEISDQALKTIGLFNGVTRAVCAAQKLRCIDLAALLQFKDGDFYDPLHTTPAGSQRIADFLFTALNRMRGR